MINCMNEHQSPTLQRKIYTISDLNSEARCLLESNFPLLWVEGEVSNFASPSSGHFYFTLKDNSSQVRCAMFRNQNRYIDFVPKNGDQVLARVRVSLYEGRGEFQLIVENLEAAGDGALQRAFEQLKQRLNREGLFEERNKKPLPSFPAIIGVVTSPTGAAIRDILAVLNRRYPLANVIIYPTLVQGEGAGQQIAKMIERADEAQNCDVLIVARGGGSLEDLWAFNEEVVAQAIYYAMTPVISGVGHEIDFTIADFVADQRAPTPSVAAEMVTPDGAALLNQFEQYQMRLMELQASCITQKQQVLSWLTQRLVQRHPGQQLMAHAQRVDELEQRLQKAMQRFLQKQESQLEKQSVALKHQVPTLKLNQYGQTLDSLEGRLNGVMQQILNKPREKLRELSRALDAVSPLATLDRGYSIVRSLPQRRVVRIESDVKPGDKIEAQMAFTSLVCTVDEIKADPS
ncbi:MAG: exodeoxyribonuclease VII large subunit [Gammaproteobacteria bacterium]|nr:exodeoxyribonuclease VII large subunit [Gammaproteobacteria bacterium]